MLVILYLTGAGPAVGRLEILRHRRSLHVNPTPWCALKNTDGAEVIDGSPGGPARNTPAAAELFARRDDLTDLDAAVGDLGAQIPCDA
jgi:hypothetical protein